MIRSYESFFLLIRDIMWMNLRMNLMSANRFRAVWSPTKWFPEPINSLLQRGGLRPRFKNTALESFFCNDFTQAADFQFIAAFVQVFNLMCYLFHIFDETLNNIQFDIKSHTPTQKKNCQKILLIQISSINLKICLLSCLFFYFYFISDKDLKL